MKLYLFFFSLVTSINVIKAQIPPEFNITYFDLEEKPKGLSRYELFPNDSAFYEDDDYLVLRHCDGEWGGSVVFKHKASGLRYYCAATCPVMINKFNGYYYITASLDHMTSSTQIIEIKDPKKLNLKIRLEKRLPPGTIMPRGSDYDTSRTGSTKVASARGFYTLASFVSNGVLYHLISDTGKSYIAAITDGKFEIVKKLTDYYLNDNEYIPRTTADGHCQLYFESDSGMGYIDIAGKDIRFYRSENEAVTLPRGYSNEFDELYFSKYEDSLVFTQPRRIPSRFFYKSNFPYRFCLQLPVALSRYNLDDAKYSLFEYADGEKIMVTLNPSATGLEKESSCTPDSASTVEMIGRFSGSYHGNSEAPKKGRETKLIKIKGCDILLFNIKQENYPQYEQMARSFRLLHI